MPATVIIRDNASPNLQKLVDQLPGGKAGSRTLDAGADALEVAIQDHFYSRNTGSYWSDAAAATHGEVRGTDIVVGINHPGVALHYYGGTVRPRKAKFLTIPASDKYKGKRAPQFGTLQPLFFDRGTAGARSFGALVEFDEQGNFDVAYWLVKKADIPRDPDTLPPDEDMAAAVIEGIQDELNHLEGLGG